MLPNKEVMRPPGLTGFVRLPGNQGSMNDVHLVDVMQCLPGKAEKRAQMLKNEALLHRLRNTLRTNLKRQDLETESA